VRERQLPAKSQETTATNPWPLALLAQNLKNYVDKVPELWVEAQVASFNGRGGNVFMELKDVQEDFSFTLALFGRAGSGLAAAVTVATLCCMGVRHGSSLPFLSGNPLFVVRSFRSRAPVDW